MAKEPAKVEKLTRKDFLIDFRNYHLRRKVAAEIDFTEALRLELSGQNPQKGLMEQQEKRSALQKIIDNAEGYLRIIDNLIQEEEKE